jgi:phenylpyruvate tautomerase PptA (4-oxalocrotonate tautomerase family)
VDVEANVTMTTGDETRGVAAMVGDITAVAMAVVGVTPMDTVTNESMEAVLAAVTEMVVEAVRKKVAARLPENIIMDIWASWPS